MIEIGKYFNYEINTKTWVIGSFINRCIGKYVFKYSF